MLRHRQPRHRHDLAKYLFETQPMATKDHRGKICAKKHNVAGIIYLEHQQLNWLQNLHSSQVE